MVRTVVTHAAIIVTWTMYVTGLLHCELGCKAGWTGISCNQGKAFICINEKMLMEIQCSSELN